MAGLWFSRLWFFVKTPSILQIDSVVNRKSLHLSQPRKHTVIVVGHKTITLKYIAFIFVSTFYSLNCFSQIQEADFYEKAYIYLNDSILKNDFTTASKLAQACNECCLTGIALKFKPELQVANKFIQNNHGFPYNDFAIKKYDLSDDCLRSLRMGVRDCELANQVLDSLDRFWLDYKMKSDDEIRFALENLLSDTKDGYQVFFSDIYRSTLAAELKEFCLPFDEGMWMGASTLFFFVFDENGEIKQVYSGRTIYYN